MRYDPEFYELIRLIKSLSPERREALKQYLEEFDRFYTLNEVAKTLRVSLRTIYRYIKSGKLKAVKINGRWRVPPEEFERIKGEGIK